MCLVCVPITVRDEATAIADALAAKDAGADIIELRVDEFFDGSGELTPKSAAESVMRIIKASPLPAIVTCRASAEGGAYTGDEADRVAFIEHIGVGDSPPMYIDVELATFERSANLRQKVRLAVDHAGQVRDAGARLLLSAHDFQERPKDLSRKLLAMGNENACAVIKVAYRARSLRDNVDVLELPGLSPKPTIALAMGEFGLASRVLAGKAGALLTFAPLTPSATTAPGQPTVRELLGTYRFRSINSETKVFGVVGYPVQHSLGPHVHNASFEALGESAVYLPLPVVGGATDDETDLSLRSTLLELLSSQTMNLHGCSVTMPHKESLLRLASREGWEVDPFAKVIGAANTLVRRGDAFRVLNTDAPAIAGLLDHALREAGRSGLQGSRVGIVGAGGTARAAACAVLDAGGCVDIYARTPERAQRLAQDVATLAKPGRGVAVHDLHELPRAFCHAFINATPIGMTSGSDPMCSALPVMDMVACRRETVVLESVYHPVMTPTLLAAADRGWRAIDGVSLFVEQASLQLSAWLQREAPKALISRVARETLAQREKEKA